LRASAAWLSSRVSALSTMASPKGRCRWHQPRHHQLGELRPHAEGSAGDRAVL
jgi:hypothetical protein